MKLLSPFVGFLLVCLWASVSDADISLSLRNKQYLSPPIQKLPVRDDYYNTKDNTQQHHHKQPEQQQTFEEKKYGNSRYQIFEVHNHYELSAGTGENKQKSSATQTNFVNNNNNDYYSPSVKSKETEEIRIEHINAPAGFPLDDPNLEASYLSVAANNKDSNQQIIVKHESKTVQTTSNNIPVPFPSNYRLTFTEKSKRKQNFNSVRQSVLSVKQYQQNQKQGLIKFEGPDYLPPKTQEVLRRPVQNSLNTQSQAYHSSQQKSTVGTTRDKTLRGPEYLAPLKRNNNKEALFKVPDYLSPRQQTSVQSQQNFVSNAPFKGPDYLPPQQHDSAQSQQNFIPNGSFKGPDYLPPQQHGSVQLQQNFEHNAPFKGPDYLPPRQQTPSEQSTFLSSTPHNEPVYVLPQQTNFKAPDYLPPHQDNSNQYTSFKGPNLLLPQQQQQQQVTSNLNTPFKGPDYLPPYQQQQQKPIHFQLSTSNQFKGPDYLPPHQSNTNEPFKGPNYLPPQENQNQAYQQQAESLPLGYDFQKPPNSEQAIAELHTLPEQSPQYQAVTVQSQIQVAGEQGSDIVYRTSKQINPPQNNGYLPPGNDLPKPDNAEQAINQLHSQEPTTIRQAADGYLPPGYDFQKPDNAEQAINQLHSLDPSFQHSHSQVTQARQTYHGTQQFKGPDYLPPTFGSQNYKGPDYLPPTTSSQDYKGPNYLPPVVSAQTAVLQNNQYTSEVFKGPVYLPPVNVQQSYQTPQQAQFKGPDYLPPNTQGFKPTSIYRLSSYMSNIKPNDRYGYSRSPFSRQPPSQLAAVSTSYDLSPMYRELASRPQYYAPTMSYTSNTFNTFSKKPHQNAPALSQQARQALQTFMPEDIRQNATTDHYNTPTTDTAVSTTIHASQPTTAKIRTVQIVNPNGVKTLKVLESIDHTGVKTIKILGPSHELPMGNHRVVKVVSGGHGQNVQTVKIFNDHEAVPANKNVHKN